MPGSNYHQSSFLGGEWGPLSKGRSDVPAYASAMEVSLNGIIVEEGAWTRRSGFEFIAPTHNRQIARLIPYVIGDPNQASNLTGSAAYGLEFTPNRLRFLSGASLVVTPNQPTVTASSLSGGILSLTLSSAAGFNVGDDAILGYDPTMIVASVIGPLAGRVIQVLTVNYGTNVITVGTDTGGTFSGFSSGANALNGVTVYQIAMLTTPYAANELGGLRAISTNTNMVLLSFANPPNVFVIGSGNPTIAEISFADGPFLDLQGGNDSPETGTVNAYTGSIVFTPTTSTFTSTDIGRMIRLYSQPPVWNSGTTYSYGQVVSYNGGFWTSVAAGAYAALNTGVTPGTNLTSGGVQVMVWAPAPQAGVWAWGTITGQTGSTATVELVGSLNSANGATISQWRLGVYQTGHWPTCGVYYEGRLWLAGAYPNRVDASVSNSLFQFSPTDSYGQVTDANALNLIGNSDENAVFQWLKPDQQGLLVGSLTSEWLIQASTLNDPITPTSVQMHRVTKYGCAFAEPVRVGMSLIFVQRYTRRLIEYLADTFSNKFTGRHVNEFAKHLSESGIAEIAYQEETVPIIWARMINGTLAGCTYRRVSHFVAEAPVFQAWHRHVIGGDYAGDELYPVQSIMVLPGVDDLSDSLYVVRCDLNAANSFIELLRPLYEQA
jgi:hypothetical protein